MRLHVRNLRQKRKLRPAVLFTQANSKPDLAPRCEIFRCVFAITSRCNLSFVGLRFTFSPGDLVPFGGASRG